MHLQLCICGELTLEKVGEQGLGKRSQGLLSSVSSVYPYPAGRGPGIMHLVAKGQQTECVGVHGVAGLLVGHWRRWVAAPAQKEILTEVGSAGGGAA